MSDKMCELRLSSSTINSDTEQKRLEELRKEREARSLAIEKAYVHDVYEQISENFSDSRYRPWPRVKQFIMDLEPGSFVCDVGCGSGKYLSINPLVFKIGSDRCKALTEIAREKEHEVLICDNMALPYRDESFDAVMSIAVIHHIATTERRVRAIRELARILRVGGRIIISVWSMEQKHRKFESQDVLIPWHRPTTASSADEKAGSGSSHHHHQVGGDTTTTTTCTSEDDITHYHAYTQTGSESESLSVSRLSLRRKGRSRFKGRSSFSPAGGRSSSDLSSPNETCYSFVRKAIQKFAAHKKAPPPPGSDHKLSWFLPNIENYYSKEMEVLQRTRLEKGDSADSNANDDLPIEIRHLEEGCDLLLIPPLLTSSILSETTLAFANRNKSRSLNDLSELSRSCRKMLREHGRSNTCDDPTVTACSDTSQPLPISPKKQKLEPAASCQSVESSDGSTGWLSRSFLLLDPGTKVGGSLSSLSSAKSAISAFSIKSDSGISARLSASFKQSHQSQDQGGPVTKKMRRIWSSDSQLGGRPVDRTGTSGTEKSSCQGERSAEQTPEMDRKQRVGNLSRQFAASLGGFKKAGKTRSLSSFFKTPTLSGVQPAEKEKSRAMQNIEGKLMVAIKEVNESDASENNTPSPSPGFVAPVATSPAVKKREHRPALVKQKQSIQAFSFPDQREMAAYEHYKELRKELNPHQEQHGSRETQSPSPFRGDTLDASASTSATATDILSKDQPQQPPSVLSPPTFKVEDMSESNFDSKTENAEDEAKGETSGKPSFKTGSMLSVGHLPKQVSLNDELFCEDRQRINKEIKKDLFRQQSLPEKPVKKSPTRSSLRETFLQATSGPARQFDIFKEGLTKFRSSSSSNVEGTTSTKDELTASSVSVGGSPVLSDKDPKPSTSSLKTGIAKILHRWKSEQDASTEQKLDESDRSASGSIGSNPLHNVSFTRKKGVNIDPINVFGLRRDQSLDSATRRNLFHRKGAWSPKSPKSSETHSPLENPCLLSPTIRRCCMEYQEEGTPGPGSNGSGGLGSNLSNSKKERRLSRSEAGSDSSKDSSIQSDTSLDSEDSCISVIFVPHPDKGTRPPSVSSEGEVSIATSASGPNGSKQSPHSQRSSTSNSSESSESPTNRGSPMSPGTAGHHGAGGTFIVSGITSSPGKGLSSVKVHSKIKTQGTMSSPKELTPCQGSPCLPAQSTDIYLGGNEDAVGRVLDNERSTYPTLANIPEIPEDVPDSPPSVTVTEVSKQANPTEEKGPSLQRISSAISLKPVSKPVICNRKSFEMEDLPTDNPIKCNPFELAERVEIAESDDDPTSPYPTSCSEVSKFDYPIVKHHPLFAKSRSSISSLLLGENILYMRKQGPSPSQGIQSVQRTAPKLLTFEIFNPEFDDLDSDESISSSPDSDDSIVSVINEKIGCDSVPDDLSSDEESLKHNEENVWHSKNNAADSCHKSSRRDGNSSKGKTSKGASILKSNVNRFQEEHEMSHTEGKRKRQAGRKEDSQEKQEKSLRSKKEFSRRKSYSKENRSKKADKSESSKVNGKKLGLSKDSSQESSSTPEKIPLLPMNIEGNKDMRQEAEVSECRNSSKSQKSVEDKIIEEEKLDSPNDKNVEPQKDDLLKEIERKSELRKRDLMLLLGENKTVLDNLNESLSPWKCTEVEKIAIKTANQLQSMEKIEDYGKKPEKEGLNESIGDEIEIEDLSQQPISVSKENTKNHSSNKNNSGNKEGETDEDSNVSNLEKGKISNQPSVGRNEDDTMPEIIISDESEIVYQACSEDSAAIDEKGKTPLPVLEEVVQGDIEEGSENADKTSAISKEDPSEHHQIQSNQISKSQAKSDDLKYDSDNNKGKSKDADMLLSELRPTQSLDLDDNSDQQTDLSTSTHSSPSGKDRSENHHSSSHSQNSSTCGVSVKSDTVDNSHSSSSSIAAAGAVGSTSSITSSKRFTDRKKRDDSVESNTASIKSIHHSDTGSVLSHRYSTISISSNVSSDVSFGNTSAVSGSSCYLASMSSADFDDRPPLASSFSLSEAEENEYLNNQETAMEIMKTSNAKSEGQDSKNTSEESSANAEKSDSGRNQPSSVEPVVKKDQLSPPRMDSKSSSSSSSLSSSSSQERPKLKSLFKRGSGHSNDGFGGRSRSSSSRDSRSLHSSNESRSRDGGTEEAGTTSSGTGGTNGGQSSCGGYTANNGSNGSGPRTPRSRIGTVSSLTPNTSLEQNTCIERRGSSSFEEELLRSFNKDDSKEGPAGHGSSGHGSNMGSDSDDDSGEGGGGGGSLTHHRYYHVFREGEIDHIIEKYVENLHIIRSYYDHANWCIIAEKVNVWTI